MDLRKNGNRLHNPTNRVVVGGVLGLWAGVTGVVGGGYWGCSIKTVSPCRAKDKTERKFKRQILFRRGK